MATANNKQGSYDKMYITFNLLHTLPVVNANGNSFDPKTTETATASVVDGYLNLEHIKSFNIGSVIDAEYKENENGIGFIECVGVIWKSSLEEYGLESQDILDGKFDISMEVAYTDYYFKHGEETVQAEGNEHLENYIGEQFEEKEVVEVIKPLELTGGALTETPADRGAIIKDIMAKVASMNNKDENDNDDDTQTKGGTKMFKEFETEEEYNTHIEKMREGYAKVEDILNKLPEDLQAEDLDTVVEEVASLKGELEETQANFEDYKKEILFKERKATLEDLEVEVAEDSKEEIINMSEATFKMLVDSNKAKMESIKESNASVVDNDEDLDLSVQVDSDSDYDENTAINAL